MPKQVLYVGAWLGATLVAVLIASAAVGTVRSESEQPGATSPYFAPTTIASGITTSTTAAPPSSTTTTTAPPSSTSTSTTTTTTPSSSSTSSTTTTTVAGIPRTYSLDGGTVTILATNPFVTLIGAVPNAGFTVDVEEAGPTRVKVEFESESHESEFDAYWSNGELIVDIDED